MENTSGEPCARRRDSGGNSRSLSPAPPIWHPTTQQSQMVKMSLKLVFGEREDGF
jgi:hypothetical protein